MHCHGVLQTVFLTITALILFQVRKFDALPLASTPAARAARHADPSPADKTGNAFVDSWKSWSTTGSRNRAGGGFRVFPKKNRLNFQAEEGGDAPPADAAEGDAAAADPAAGDAAAGDAAAGDAAAGDAAAGDAAAGDAAAGDAAAAGPAAGGPAAGGPAAGQAGAGQAGAGQAGAGQAGGGQADAGSTKATELTVSIPRFQVNEQGKMEYNPWAATYGHQFMDTRFRKNHRPRVTIALNPVKNYYPSVNLTAVCINRSTVYNMDKVERWLMRSLTSKKRTNRPFSDALRREIFNKAESESCHNSEYNDWMKYQECALRRNQRMEYFVPKYPLHQVVAN